MRRVGSYYYASNSSANSSTVSNVVQSASNLKSSSMTVTTASSTDSHGYPYVQVTVSYPFQTLTSWPGIPRTVTLSRKVAMIRTY